MWTGVTLGKRLEPGCNLFYFTSLFLSQETHNEREARSVRHYLARTDEIWENTRWLSKLRPQFEPNVFRTQVYSVSAKPACLLGGCQGCGNEFPTLYTHTHTHFSYICIGKVGNCVCIYTKWKMFWILKHYLLNISERTSISRLLPPK